MAEMVGCEDGIQSKRDSVLCGRDVENPRVFEVDVGEVREYVLVLHGPEHDGPSARSCRCLRSDPADERTPLRPSGPIISASGSATVCRAALGCAP